MHIKGSCDSLIALNEVVGSRLSLELSKSHWQPILPET